MWNTFIKPNIAIVACFVTSIYALYDYHIIAHLIYTFLELIIPTGLLIVLAKYYSYEHVLAFIHEYYRIVVPYARNNVGLIHIIRTAWTQSAPQQPIIVTPPIYLKTFVPRGKKSVHECALCFSKVRARKPVVKTMCCKNIFMHLNCAIECIIYSNKCPYCRRNIAFPVG
jgi:hypothetical protein